MPTRRKPLFPPQGRLLAALWLPLGLLTGGRASRLPAQPAEGLFTPRPSFDYTNRLVSVSVFQWFTANGGQLSGPWRPVEGRANWTGTTDFWRTQIKQMMAANFDILYVHLIPSSEEQRVNLFRALYQLRREGWNVPKVAPFLDPMITWHQQPPVDVATAAGKDTFVGQYIRWFNQYYSVNPDAYADDYLARINNRPLLDTWHVKFNLTNLSMLSRADVESRLRDAFAAQHPLFTNGIYMVTTAYNDPTFVWADEKVPQFEINQYSALVRWRGLLTVQLKGGYWDQNIRNPGDFLPRAGGVPYSNAWSRLNRAVLNRVYVESWNEYDEGSGIYAAHPGPPYIKPGSGNTNTDVWSLANDPYEYIRTTARGAAAFNDWPERDAKILWHNLPTRLQPGETRAATVIVRNEGDAFWSEAAQYRFGQNEALDPVLFGPARCLINDAQDDIPTYGGIFRGRPKTFTLALQAPATPGFYTNHWRMLQEGVGWFGEELVHTIRVDPTPLYRGTNQAIDSTALLTNVIADATEHTYAATNLPVGSLADCRITRTFAAPIKSLRLSLVAGTADDIGYVGSLLVTPDSAGQTCRLGHVTNAVDVTRAATVSGNTVTLTLRARDTCCCFTGWGEDTGSGRANARLQWEVELWPPVPASPVFSNAANGHLYLLLSPATWTWSEQAAGALGGHLATVRNSAEQDWLFQTLAGFAGLNRLLWIGLNDVAKEGTFVWSSGEPVGFTYWAPGEPNNALGGEDFVTLYPPGHTQAGRWNDWGERVLDGTRPFNGVVELIPPMGPPRITVQPLGRKLNPGATFSLSVGAVGSPPLTYQWRRDGQEIPGATAPALTVSPVQFADAGNYAVRVTNPLGAVDSADARLIVNHPPVALPQTVTLDEDTSLPITLTGEDAEGDPLAFALLTKPEAGRLTGSAPLLTYRPDANYFGSDHFSFSVRDGMLESEPATVTIHVRPVNDAPVAQEQTVTLAEDTPTAIILSGWDVEGDALSFSILAPPLQGDLSGDPPRLTYQPRSNYFGPDTFTFQVHDGQLAASARVHLQVEPVNDAPTARFTVAPRVVVPGLSNLLVIAPPCTNTVVALDASESSDVEDDPLAYRWFLGESTNAAATGVVAVVTLPVGSHSVTLVVHDGAATDTARAELEVLPAARAIERLLLAPVQEAALPCLCKVWLQVILGAAEVAVLRDHLRVAVQWLECFQQEVRRLVRPRDASLAERLLTAAEAVQEVVQDCVHRPRPPCRWQRLVCHADGRLRLHFTAPHGPAYVVEASPDLLHWEMIGVARRCAPGEFAFEDARAARLSHCFYRVVSP